MTENSDLLKIQRSSMSRQVADVIRDMILTGRLRPGERLVQAEWADRLGVSRMPVRDAITQLVAEGTIVQATSGSAIVARIDHRDLRDAYRLNAIVSSMAARRAAEQISADQLAAVIATHQEIISAVARDDRAAAADLNWEFHRQVNRAADSPRLTALLATLAPSIPHSAFEMLADWPERAIAEHAAIIEALRYSDGDAAERLMQAHIEDGSRHMLADIDEHAEHDERVPDTGVRAS